MNSFSRVLKRSLCVVLALTLILSFAGCSNSKSEDVDQLPLVYSDDGQLKCLAVGSKEATTVSENFNPGYGNITRAKFSEDGRYLYYIESSSPGSLLGTLYKKDLKKSNKEPEKLHENTYSFDFSADGKVLLIMEGAGKLIKYSKSSEKKDNYETIEDNLVSEIVKISDNGKYVLYKRVLPTNSGVYSLCLAQTSFQQNEDTKALDKDGIVANKSLSKGPVVVSEANSEVVFVSGDLSAIYFTAKGKESTSLGVFKGLKSYTTITDSLDKVLGADEDGNILYTETEKGSVKPSELLVDKLAKKDAKLKAPKTSDKKAVKKYRAKQKRDRIRKALKSYLKTLTKTAVYSVKSKATKSELIASYTGFAYNTGVDAQQCAAVFAVTNYELQDAKKLPKIEDITNIYDEVLSPIRSQYISLVSQSGEFKFDSKTKASYNGGDTYLDTVNHTFSVLLDYNFSSTKRVGKLFTAQYSSKGFRDVESLGKASALAKVPSKSNTYYIGVDGKVYLGDKLVDIKAPLATAERSDLPVFLKQTSKGDTVAYVVKGGDLEKLGKCSGKFVTKGDTFVYYSKYDLVSKSMIAHYYDGKQVIDLGKKVNYVMNY